MAPKDTGECNRRKEDGIAYKIKQVGVLLAACGTIATAMIWLGGTVFVTKTESQQSHETLYNKLNQTTDRVNYCEKDVLVIKTQVQAIHEGQQRQEIMLREIRDDLRRTR